MTSSDPGRERRKNRRRDVSFPARFTADGRTIHRAVVRSLSAEGMFLETTALVPIRATIRIVAALPDEGREPLRVEATVLYHNRRGLAGAVGGFGLQFVNPSLPAPDRIEALLDRYPAQVPTDGLGTMVWPVEVPTIDPGWRSVAWWNLDPETAEIDAATTGEEPSHTRLQRWLAATPDDVAPAPEGLVAFHFYGKALAPAMGVPRAHLDQPPVAKALAAQMWAIETLEAARWNLVELTREQAAAIGAAGRVLDMAREELEANASLAAHAPSDEGLDGAEGSAADREPAARGEELPWGEVAIALRPVAEFLDVLRYNLQGLPALEPSATRPDEPRTDAFLRAAAQEVAQIAARVAGGEGRAASGAGATTPATPTGSAAHPSTLRLTRRHLAGAGIAIGLLALTGVAVQRLRHRPPESYGRYLALAREALSALSARNADRLEDRLRSAHDALGTTPESPASTLALELGLAGIRYLDGVAALEGSAQSLHEVPWGPGKRYPSKESYERWRERDRARAQGWIETSEQIASQILNSDAPFAREQDPSLLDTLDAGHQWLSERRHQLELLR